MKRVAMWTAVAAMVVGSGAVAGVEGEKPPTRISLEGLKIEEIAGKTNAALLYAQAWAVVDRETLSGMAEMVQAKDNEGAQRKANALLEQNQRFIEAVLRASNEGTCEWGINYDEGWKALLPQLWPMRGTARALAADARRLAGKGTPEGRREAGKRVAAIFRMSGHVTSDPVLISSLVGAAMSSLACAEAEGMIGRGEMDHAAARLILNAVREMGREDPFSARLAIAEGEAGWSLAWIRREFTGPKAGERFNKEALDGVSTDPMLMGRISKMDGEAMASELDKAEAYFVDVMRVWDDPDAKEKLAEIARGVGEGKYGVLGRVMLPAVGSVRETVTRELKKMDDLVAKLEKILSEAEKVGTEKKVEQK